MGQRTLNGDRYEEVFVRGSSDSSVYVGGRAYRNSVVFTRPTDTTVYTAGDVIGTNSSGSAGSAIHTFATIGPSGNSVILQSAELLIESATVPSGMSAFRLHLYNLPPTAALDNTAFDLALADRSKYVGYVDFSTPTDLGSVLYSQVDFTGKLLMLATGSTALYCELQTTGSFTPTSGTVFELRLKTLEVGL